MYVLFIYKLNFVCKFQVILGVVGYRTFKGNLAKLRITRISMENIGHQIGHSLYTAA